MSIVSAALALCSEDLKTNDVDATDRETALAKTAMNFFRRVRLLAISSH